MFVLLKSCRGSHAAIFGQIMCLNQAVLSFHFIVTREVSAFSIPPGFFAEQTLVSKVMDLPSQRLAWCGGTFILCCQGEPPDWLGRPRHCRPALAACAHRARPKLLLSEQPWPLFARAETVKQKKERERENKWACFRAAFGLWVCEEATAASQRHFTATPKVEQLFFRWGWKARWAIDIEMTLCCSCKPLFELLYLFWISTQSVLPLYTSKI